MHKLLILVVLLLIAIPLLADWLVGEMVTTDYSWTDSNGEYHSIHELTASGKAVVIFWGTGAS